MPFGYSDEEWAAILRAFPSDEEALAAARPETYNPYSPVEDAAPRGDFDAYDAPQLAPYEPPEDYNPFLAMQAQRAQEIFDRNAQQTSISPLDAFATMLGGVGNNIDRARGALFAAAEEGGPILSPQSLGAAWEGFQNPEQYGGGDLLQRAGMGDANLWGEAPGIIPDNISVRDLLGGAADIAFDPLNVFGAGVAGRGLSGFLQDLPAAGAERVAMEGPQMGRRAFLDLAGRSALAAPIASALDQLPLRFGDVTPAPSNLAEQYRRIREASALETYSLPNRRGESPGFVPAERAIEAARLNPVLEGRGLRNTLQRLAAAEGGGIDLDTLLPIGPVRTRPDAPEAGIRPGNLLRPRGAEQLGPDYTVKDVLGVARDLQHQSTSQLQTVRAQGVNALAALGKAARGTDGNWYIASVRDAAGKPALLEDVLENPNSYTLNPVQRQAVDSFAEAYRMVKTEREIFGVPPHELDLEEGANYIHRRATSTAKGDLNARPGGNVGRRLGVGSEQSRRVESALDAVHAGVVYDHPLKALEQYTADGFKRAADEHVKNLLVPFSETSAMRVPPGLRAQHEMLLRRLQSLQGVAGRLDDRTRTAVAAHLNAVEPDLDALYVDLSGITARSGDTAPEVKAALEAVKAEIREMRPAWKDAVARSKSTPQGRQGISIDLAPALAGRDFLEADAKAIRRYYSNGILADNTIGKVLRGLGQVNKKIIPMRAIGDASATLLQLGTILPSHPVKFAKNFGTAAYESLFPGGEAHYYRWLADPEVREAAAHGVALVGEGGAESDFFASWLSRVPVLKQTQRHFEIIGNRNRVDAWRTDMDMLRRTGQPVDDKAGEQAARAVNRITGVAHSRVTDAETLAEFAPNWMRSRLETLDHALRDGALEGRLARQYLRNYVGTGMVMVAGVAAAQGRDLKEVLQPITPTQDGRWRFNPNFGTMRFHGQDISAFSGYQDLARLAVMFTDAAVGAIKERDLRELAEPLVYLARTKGAPWATIGADLIADKNIVGDDVASWTYWLTQFLPIGAAQQVRTLQKGEGSWTGAGVQFLGGRANPMTPVEKITVLNGGVDPFDKTETTGKELEALKEKYPEVFEEWLRSARDETQRYHADKARTLRLQTELDAAYKAGDIRIDDWEKANHDLLMQSLGRREEIFREAEDRPHDIPIVQAHFDQIDASKTKWEAVNWRVYDKWYDTLSADEKETLAQYTGLGGTPFQKERKAVAAELDKTGYFDRFAKAWVEVQQATDPATGAPLYPQATAFESGDVYKQHLFATRKRAYLDEGYTPGQATLQANKDAASDPLVEEQSKIANVEEELWILAHPELAAQAIEVGYLNDSILRNTEEAAILGRFAPPPKATATPKATSTPKATATATSTATPKATSTPKTTATPTPVSTPVSIEDARNRAR